MKKIKYIFVIPEKIFLQDPFGDDGSPKLTGQQL